MKKSAWVKPMAFVLLSLPFLGLVFQALSGRLSANPIEDLTHQTGDWGLRMLLLTLAITPARQWLSWSVLARLRRMVGLFAFFYVSLHLAVWGLLDQGLDGQAILEDVVERPFITVGFAAWLLLLPLALTSTNGMVKRLGGRRWKRLHQSVYLIAILGCVHFWWLVKADWREPLLYSVLLALLLGLRVLKRV